MGVSVCGFRDFSGIVTFLFWFFFDFCLFQENMKVLLRLCFIAVLISSLEAGK